MSRLGDFLKRLVKPVGPSMDCHECERLNHEEADAAIDLAKEDDSAEARNRLTEARERLKAHRDVRHPLRCSALSMG